MITPFQILTFFIYSGAVVLAIYFATSIAEDGMVAFVKIAGWWGVLAWISFGAAIWWLPLFFGYGLGGEFYYGFKILMSEAGLLAGIVALLPSLALRRVSSIPPRQGLPLLVWLFLAYLAIHFLYSLKLNGRSDLIALGSIFRNYFNAGWGLLFLVLFRYYGRSQHLIWALYALEAGALVRAAGGICSSFWPGLLYLPVVNFILPGFGPGGSGDLRWAGLSLAQVTIPLFFDKKGGVMKLIHALAFGVAVVALLMGGGRGACLASFATVIAAALYSRKWLMMGTVLFLMTAGLVGLNRSPQWLDSLPEQPRRTLSILILKNHASFSQEEAEASNAYHRDMFSTGWKRWTANWGTILFGTGVKPYDWSVKKLADAESSWWIGIEAAADSGNYEVALWNVMALMGLTAMLCDLGLMGIFCWRVGRLSAVAGRDRYGRVFSFMTYALTGQWVVMCALQGSIPSFEIAMGGLAAIYLDDRAREEEERNRKPAPVPAIPYPA